jgi:hypothetical protein
MKNITVSVDEEVYHRARIKAAEMRTSLSALVRKSLEALSAEETEFERLQRLEQKVAARLRTQGSRFSGADRVPREEIHDRDALR